MKLTAEQVKRLTTLADFMDRLTLGPKDEFSMHRFWQGTHKCGTPVCALGWACTVPALRAAGLTPKFLGFGNMAVDTSARADEFFGDVYLALFSACKNGHLNTPQEWAAHCRAFLKVNGYSTTDHFKTFMDRVLVPVDTKETTVAAK